MIALFPGARRALRPDATALDGPGLDVALHLSINLAQPRPLRSDSKVVEMRRRQCRSGKWPN